MFSGPNDDSNACSRHAAWSRTQTSRAFKALATGRHDKARTWQTVDDVWSTV